MQIPIINGVFTDNSPSIRTSYPKNLVPVIDQSGISNGYLRPGDGIIQNGTGPGFDRGGILWDEVCYRIMGDKLVQVDADGTVTTLGTVTNDAENSLVSMDYSFDRLAMATSEDLYYWDGSTLTQVTDVDLGVVIDMIWVDGYFMTIDGENIVTTELNDPTSVNLLKYGSSEIDPDPIKALLKLRNEPHALNRYTIEVFNNIGGDFFPFQRIKGAQIQKGVVGTHACAVYMETIAFVGSGRNEQISIYMAVNGNAHKISTREVDDILEDYTEAQLSVIKVEARNDRSSQLLYIHLPDQTIVYDYAASQLAKAPVWHILSSSITGNSQYLARNFVYAYNQWLVGKPGDTSVGFVTDTVGEHWGEVVTWQFGTNMTYNASKGAIFSELELVALTGRIANGKDPEISTQYSLDGLTWSQAKSIKAGKIGNRTKRLRWFRQGYMNNFRIQRFQGDSSAHISFARLEAKIEPLGR